MSKVIKLPGATGDLIFICGPFRQAVEGAYRIKLAPEVEGEFEYLVHIPDFGVPKQEDFEAALAEAISAAERGEVVYVGCMGGIGRTGMFLSGLVRVLRKKGAGESILWVRQNYLRRAVETRAQERMVAEFSAATVRGLIKTGGNRELALARVSRYIRRAFNFGNARRLADDNTRSS